MPKLFKLDTNIDGHYTDVNGDEQVISDFIQVVSGTDGSSFESNIYGSLTNISADDVSTIRSISGHGMIYNTEGSLVAKKGDLVIRDALGNTLNLYNLLFRTINEDNFLNVVMKDQSLVDILNNEDAYITLDSLMKGIKRTAVTAGNGNIVQLARKDNRNTNEVYVKTTPVSKEN